MNHWLDVTNIQGDSGGKVSILEVIVSVIVRKKIVRTCVDLRMVTEMELFESTNAKIL